MYIVILANTYARKLTTKFVSVVTAAFIYIYYLIHNNSVLLENNNFLYPFVFLHGIDPNVDPAHFRRYARQSGHFIKYPSSFRKLLISFQFE